MQIGIFCLPPSGVIPLHNHPGMTVFSKLLFGSMQAKSYDWVERVATCNKDNGKNLQQAPSPIATPPPATDLFQSQPTSVPPPSPLAHVSSPSNHSPVLSPPRTSSPPPASSPNPTLSPPPASSHPPVSSPELASSPPQGSFPTPASSPTPAWSSSTPVVAPRLFPQLARVHVEKELTAPCEASVLFPAAGGNLHCFKAITACAILDVLGPPYSETEGRRCTYYQDFPFPRFSDSVELEADEDVKSYVWLEEREKPEEFVVYGAHYTGPTIVGIRD
nr:plant cysteine oxidase 2-like isoform X2 [Ipomoea batatas]